MGSTAPRPNWCGCRSQTRSLVWVPEGVPLEETLLPATFDLGFEPVDAGPLRHARLLEPLAMLWISLAYVQGLGPGITFKLLRR